MEKANYLGHATRQGQLELSEAKIAALRKINDPTTRKELKYFSVIGNVFHRFVLNFSKVAVSLYKRLRKYQLTLFSSLTPDEKDAIENPKKLLTSPWLLSFSRATSHFAVDVDVCDSQVGRVLPQQQENDTSSSIGY